MIAYILPKAVEYFNSLTSAERTIEPNDIYILEMYYWKSDYGDEIQAGSPFDWENEGISGTYAGVAQYLWVAPRGANLTATPESFYLLNSTDVGGSVVALWEIATDNPNDDGMNTLIDAEWVANKLNNSSNSIDYANSVNVFAMGGDRNQHEMWITNPFYTSNAPYEPVPLHEYLMRIRPLYIWDQVVTNFPTINQALLAANPDGVVFAPFVSAVPLCFDADTELFVTYNPTDPESNTSDTGNWVRFELWYSDNNEPTQWPEGQRLILIANWKTGDPLNNNYVQLMPTEGAELMFKQGLKGHFFWLLTSSDYSAIDPAAVIKNLSFTLRVKRFNEFSDVSYIVQPT